MVTTKTNIVPTTEASDDRPSNKSALLILIPITLVVLSQSFGKLGSDYISVDDFNLLDYLNIFTILSLAFLFLRSFSWLFILKKYDISFAYPYISISYILILLVSVQFFGDEFTPGKIIGTFLITAGTFLLSWSKLKQVPPPLEEVSAEREVVES